MDLEMEERIKSDEEKELILKDFLQDEATKKKLPKPIPLPSMRTHHKVCFAWWNSEMPFYIRFPMAIFMLFTAAFLAVCTVFVGLEMGGIGPFTIANAPVWTWGAWACINFVMFFVIWAIVWCIRRLTIVFHYRLLKVTWALWGFWSPLVLLVFSLANFPLIQFLVNWNVEPAVEFWLSRIIWTLFVASIFWFVYSLLHRYLIALVEKESVFHRMANILWREEMLRQLLDAANHFHFGENKSSANLAKVVSFGPQYNSEGLSADEYEAFRGKMFDEFRFPISVPDILLAPTHEEQRQVRICRLAVNTSFAIFQKLDSAKSGTISRKCLTEALGSEERALEHLSLWDADASDSIDRHEMVRMILQMFDDRQDLVLLLEARNPLGIILGVVLGIFVVFIALIIILQVYGITVVDLVLPILSFLLPLTFIFGAAIRGLFDAFLLLFVVQPWVHGDTVTTQGQTFTVDKVSFISTSGYTAAGLFTAVSNAASLNQPLQNYGRCAPTRVRVYVRLEAPAPGRERFVVSRLAEIMRQYCESKPHLYAKDGLSVWQENGESGEFDDVRFMTVAINCGFLHYRIVDWEPVRLEKSEFIAALREAVRELGARGFCGRSMQVFLDASSVLGSSSSSAPGNIDL